MPKDQGGHGSNPRGTHASAVNTIGQRPAVDPRVIDAIRKNPDGISITPSGSQPSTGYMVSLPGHTQITNASDIQGPNGPKIISDYASQHSSALATPGAHIGSWTDSGSGKTYLDVSHNVQDRDEAVRLGKQRNQIAIWGMKEGEIKTGGTGE